MPKLLPRQEAPFEGRVIGRIPVCIVCGNRRCFWVRRGKKQVIAHAWELQPHDRLVACGRCRAPNSALFERNDN